MFFYRTRDVLRHKQEDKEGIIEHWDCINLYDVVRGWWEDMETFILMMKDGHEEAMEKDMPQKTRLEYINNKRDIPRERKWAVSYIKLHGIDIDRYRMASELMLGAPPVHDGKFIEQVPRPRLMEAPKPSKPTLSVVNNTEEDKKDEKVDEKVDEQVNEVKESEEKIEVKEEV